ncbi:hydroxyisourate hydrolase [Agreia bicolorata]|uniref:5-hydroxyisourate hydrolase n=1 Tax=Agreia bicolorata TaxID=110935 RepID=A0ABR5CDU6_9MICO|nr:hydroxyisourate hydrolase [Agreia bicolorata]KJC63806.1 5-hydroxyisourate hydrolase [Agreia bicolorata]
MSGRSHITSHVLDAATGQPAAGVPVTLAHLAGDEWHVLAEAVTDADGRVSQFGPEIVPVGRYRVTFDTHAYFASLGQAAFYPEVQVVFELADGEAHYHVPLLLSPFAYSTYRGS